MSFRHDDAGTEAEFWTGFAAARELPELAVPYGTDLVVLAAHPDDETLGAGGLIARVLDAGGTVRVVVVTDGEASHPASTTHSRGRLAAARRHEVRAALSELGCPAPPEFLGIADGRVTDHESELLQAIEAAAAWIAAPWRADGHPDHEAAGRVAARLAAARGACLLEYPVWFWHWGGRAPDRLPWTDARRLRLTPVERDRKRVALATHRTQVAPLSDRPGDEALLSSRFLGHFRTGAEVFVVTDPA